jgi:hypothetical protein
MAPKSAPSTSSDRKHGPFRRAFDQLIVTRNYLSAFWRVVVFPCLTNPDNWEYCWPPDWLVPYVQDAFEFLTVEPYANEKAILNAKDH